MAVFDEIAELAEAVEEGDHAGVKTTVEELTAERKGAGGEKVERGGFGVGGWRRW